MLEGLSSGSLDNGLPISYMADAALLQWGVCQEPRNAYLCACKGWDLGLYTTVKGGI